MIGGFASVSFCLLAATLAPFARAQEQMIPLVDIQKVDKTIKVELRYASSNNIAGRPLYPPGTRAMVRPEVAERLAVAQAYLRKRYHGLKIWDAYRPRDVQVELWRAARQNSFVADPATTNGSLHGWGLCVDATLVGERGQPVKMPTDFDDFTPAAWWHYLGPDPYIRRNLGLLQRAMAEGGFYGLRAEWWHFITSDWRNFVPDPDQFLSSDRPSAEPKL